VTLVYGCSCASECVGRTAYYRPATADFQLATMATAGFPLVAAPSASVRARSAVVAADGRTRVHRHGGRSLANFTYRCPPDRCRLCVRRDPCTPTPEKGRTVSRLEKPLAQSRTAARPFFAPISSSDESARKVTGGMGPRDDPNSARRNTRRIRRAPARGRSRTT